jgi:hypothetical protein
MAAVEDCSQLHTIRRDWELIVVETRCLHKLALFLRHRFRVQARFCRTRYFVRARSCARFWNRKAKRAAHTAPLVNSRT